MALRVLLADESSTIKKVIGLSLQDFAVEVKVVHSGIDVLEVAKQFKPDLIFADVLLQKRNGYDVCFDIKNDPILAHIPVVLMWSSFMDLDEKAYQRSKANAKLEKPFEVDHLRQLVTSLSTKTESQKASQFLKFPEIFAEPLKKEMQEKQNKMPGENSLSRLGIPAAPNNSPVHSPIHVGGNVPPPKNLAAVTSPQTPAQKPQQGPPPSLRPKPQNAEPPRPQEASKPWNMDSFVDIQMFSENDDAPITELGQPPEGFAELRLTPPTTSSGISPVTSSASLNFDRQGEAPANLNFNTEPWSQKDLANFKIDAIEDDDPFALMDLNKIDISAGTPPTSSGLKAPNEKVPKPMPPQPQVAAQKEDDISVFHFAEGEGESFELELDESEAPQASSEEPNSSWKFQLPEYERSNLEGDLVEMPSTQNQTQNHPQSLLGQTQTAQKPAAWQAGPTAAPEIDPVMIEKIVREQTREMVEKIVHKILPDMAKAAIQSELDRLLNEESHP